MPKLAPLPACGAQLRVGVLENRKHNARLLLGEVARRVSERLGAPAPVVRDKANASAPCPQDTLERIAGEVDLVLVGSAD